MSGITYSCLGVLMTIGSQPGADQHEIAEHLVLDNANCAKLIRGLEAGGWLVRRRGIDDHRRQGVYLTPEGVRGLVKMKRAVHQLERQASAVLSSVERATLMELLARLCRWPDDPAPHPGRS